MDSMTKLELLGRSAQYDICARCDGSGEARVRGGFDRWIYPAVLPDGRRVRLLKVLQTNACRNDCRYCPTRYSRDFRRLAFAPEELAAIFESLRRARKVSGLFLSSAVHGAPDATMARMIATVEILRRRYGFRGYVHLKVLPGASEAAIEAAARLADRISINLEAPSPERLRRIAPDKDFEHDLYSRLRLVAQMARDRRFRAQSATTQYVVGAAGESDREIITRTWELYTRHGLYRAYYSAYQPPDAEAAHDAPAVPLMREHRLYQTDFLFRKYGFRPEEIIYDESGNLSLEADPKTLWARHHPERFPVEINTATREELLRVPGIGPRTVQHILAARTYSRLRDLRDLAQLGAVVSRAASYILLAGRRPIPPVQRLLWPATA